MSKNIELVLAILKNEVDGDIASALEKMSADYSMTWMYKGKTEIFPQSTHNVEQEMKEIYPIRGRKYEIKNIAEGEEVVMVELIESYPNPETGFLHQTPLVLVLQIESGKIKTGRHYCDPQISYETLTSEKLDFAYKGAPNKMVIQ